MRTVLIVDDDVAVLSGLRKALRSHDDWSVEVAPDAGTALALLSTRAFDVVVSDAHMPGLGGEGLLREVLARWPMTLRVILSGQVQAVTAERLSGLAQQLIPKPVKPDTLYQLIEGALRARERLTNQHLRALVGRLGRLPSIPAIFSELNAVLACRSYELNDLVEVVQRDPGISANVLKLVNSAWFGPAEPVTSLRDAIRSVGATSLRTLVLTAGVFSGTSGLAQHLMQEAMARHLYVTALAGHQPLHPWLEAAITAAIVCDVARLLLSQEPGPEFLACELRISSGERRVAAETACFGADHALIGAVLLGDWGLPPEVVEAVELHHGPAVQVGAASAVGLASAVVERPVDEAAITALAALHGLSRDQARSLPGAAP